MSSEITHTLAECGRPSIVNQCPGEHVRSELRQMDMCDWDRVQSGPLHFYSLLKRAIVSSFQYPLCTDQMQEGNPSVLKNYYSIYEDAINCTACLRPHLRKRCLDEVVLAIRLRQVSASIIYMYLVSKDLASAST